MRAGLRLAMVSLAAGLSLGAAPALAQSAQQPPANPPPSDTIGPRELQNFSLSGTVTQPAQGPVQTRPARRSSRTAAAPPSTADVAASVSEPAPPPEVAPSPPAKVAPVRIANTERREQAAPARPLAFTPSPADTAPVQSAPQPAPAPAFSDSESAPATLAPAHGPSIFPWLLAALVIGAAAAFLLWRNRSREAYAGAARFDAFSPTPAPPVRTPPVRTPPPAPRAAPARPAPPSPTGIVSTRLRPWIDLSFVPLRCVVEDERVTFEFDLDMFNSGSKPARDVLVEASMFNAGETQDQEISAFFANPVAQGDRIPEIPPLKHVAVRTAVVAPRSQIRVFEAAGRQVFVPLIAFNALYRWSDSESQTSAAYLLGRNTSGEKMAPFRADLGPRVFPGVGARALQIGVRN